METNFIESSNKINIFFLIIVAQFVTFLSLFFVYSTKIDNETISKFDHVLFSSTHDSTNILNIEVSDLEPKNAFIRITCSFINAVKAQKERTYVPLTATFAKIRNGRIVNKSTNHIDNVYFESSDQSNEFQLANFHIDDFDSIKAQLKIEDNRHSIIGLKSNYMFQRNHEIGYLKYFEMAFCVLNALTFIFYVLRNIDRSFTKNFFCISLSLVGFILWLVHQIYNENTYFMNSMLILYCIYFKLFGIVMYHEMNSPISLTNIILFSIFFTILGMSEMVQSNYKKVEINEVCMVRAPFNLYDFLYICLSICFLVYSYCFIPQKTSKSPIINMLYQIKIIISSITAFQVILVLLKITISTYGQIILAFGMNFVALLSILGLHQTTLKSSLKNQEETLLPHETN